MTASLPLMAPRSLPAARTFAQDDLSCEGESDVRDTSVPKERPRPLLAMVGSVRITLSLSLQEKGPAGHFHQPDCYAT